MDAGTLSLCTMSLAAAAAGIITGIWPVAIAALAPGALYIKLHIDSLISNFIFKIACINSPGLSLCGLHYERAVTINHDRRS